MYKIYCDMDGVLVDLASSVERTLNITLDVQYRHTTERYPHILQALNDLYQQDTSIGIFRDANKMPDANHLWNYVTQYDVEILSSTGPTFVSRIGFEKRTWIRKYKGDYKVNLVPESHLKAKFAAPNHILIDDQEKSINPWQDAGGIGILHSSAKDTIKQLNKIGL